MTFAEINKRFTDKVMEYLAKGYAINTSGCTAGYSGEHMRVELTNGKDIIAIRLVEDSGGLFSGRTVNIVVGIADAETLRKNYVKPNMLRNETLWADKITELDREVFYQVGNRWDANWFTTEEEQKRTAELRRQRQRECYGFGPKKIDLTDMRGVKEIALRWVQRKKYSTYKLKDIESVEKWVYDYDGEHVRYHIHARGKDFCVSECVRSYR